MSLPTGSIFPSPDILNELDEGKFVLSNLAAKRARQLKDGAPPLIRVESNHPLTIALAEIAAKKIKPILGREAAEAEAEGGELAVIDDELLPSELGILLPALDEAAEQELFAKEVHADEHEEDLEEAAANLTDLLGEGEVEVVAPEGDEETLSLTDIADQENLEEEEDAVE